MRILITGGSGLLGSKMTEKAIEKGHKVYSGYNTHESTLGIPLKLDICDRAILQKILEDIKPEVVIHTAASTNVDVCEQDKELAWKVNVEGTKNVAELSCRHKTFMVFVSTDYVFSGEKGMYEETDENDPINYYGITKLEGEKTIKTLMDEWLIARPSVIYGANPAAGKVNFALWILEKLNKEESIKVITDQIVSPTLNTNLAMMILEAAEKRLTGIYHLAGDTPINRFNFAKNIAEKFGLNKDLIIPAKSIEMKWTARRPKNTSLSVEKAKKTLQNKPLTIKEAINELKKELEKGKLDKTIPR